MYVNSRRSLSSGLNEISIQLSKNNPPNSGANKYEYIQLFLGKSWFQVFCNVASQNDLTTCVFKSRKQTSYITSMKITLSATCIMTLVFLDDTVNNFWNTDSLSSTGHQTLR